jgi:hypothetical protein
VRRGVVVVAASLLWTAGGLAAQQRPRIEVALFETDSGPPDAIVTLSDLLVDDRFVSAVRSGFPLYLAYEVELRESRSLWDRSVARDVWEYVILYDPVRDVYDLEDPGGTEQIRTREGLERVLGRAVRFRGVHPDGPGTYHYRASVTARTLSDEDSDEIFAWLKGEDGDRARRGRPGFVTRAARRLLVQVAPLPRVTLEGRTETFTTPRR